MKLLKKPKAPYVNRIGAVRIEVDELIRILTDFQISEYAKPEIKNGSYEFSSLADAKNNKQLLVGKPSLKFLMPANSFNIDFRNGLTLTLASTENEEELAQFDKATAELKAFRTPFYFLGNRFILFILLLLIGINFLSLNLFQEVQDIYEKNELYKLVKRAMFFLMIPIIYVSHILNSDQVLLNSRKNLLNEIHDKAISSLIIFVAGAFLFWAATKLGTRL